MKLWNSVEKTNPAHTKKAKIGGMSITAIAPQYQIKRATEAFGPYAIKWGFKDIELDFSLLEELNLIVFKGTFFCPEGECKIINSAKAYMDRLCEMVDADFAKKIETDALTKVLSKMGFNADVFMGRYDDHKYVEQVRAEFAPKPMTKSDALALLGAAVDVAALGAAWGGIPVNLKQDPDVLGEKEVRKIELSTK